MIFINRRDGRQLETVDEFTTTREAAARVREYLAADRSAVYYASARACAAWRAATNATNEERNA